MNSSSVGIGAWRIVTRDAETRAGADHPILPSPSRGAARHGVTEHVQVRRGAQRLVFHAPPRLVQTGVHHQDAARRRQRREEPPEEMRVTGGFAEVVDAGEAIVRWDAVPQQRAAQPFARHRQGDVLEPRDAGPEVPPEGDVRVADIGLHSGRKRLQEGDEPVAHAGQLVSVMAGGSDASH